MDSTKHRVQINVEACTLNLGKAVRRDSSTIGFKRTYIDLSFSSETCKDVERQVYFTFTMELGMQWQGGLTQTMDRQPLLRDLPEGCEGSVVL